MLQQAPPIFEGLGIKSRINTNTDFWALMRRLNWCDRSDGVINLQIKKKSIASKYNKADIKKIHATIKEKSRELRAKMIDLEFFKNLSEKQKREVLAHIVGKGERFYDYVKSNPNVAAYIVTSSEHQDLLAIFNT